MKKLVKLILLCLIAYPIISIVLVNVSIRER